MIGIGGAHSGAGKTACAGLLFRHLRGWGGIKCTKTGLYASITDDPEILRTADKDTCRMLEAGAERVLWVQSPPAELGEVLPAAVERLSDLRGIVVEGNSAIEFLKPDIIIFISGTDPGRMKEGAREILQRADVVVPGEEVSAGAFMDNVIAMVENKEKIRSALQEKAANGMISCHLARKLAEDLGVPYHEVGKAADDLGIKIMSCELGCF